MIDLHIHMIPGIDDGAQSMETALEMAYSAYQSGVSDIVVTPHFYPGLYDNYADERLEKKWGELSERLQKERIPVVLFRGMEILGTDHLCEDLIGGRVWTLNDTKYFLVEFDFDEDPDYCSRILKKSADAGYIPVIAHPERYYFVQRDPALVYRWYMSGYGIQLNKGSILGYFGKREKETAASLLRHRIVSCVASDAHNMTDRTPSFTKLCRHLTEEYGSSYTNLLTNENPLRILKDRRLVGYDPIPYNYMSERRSSE